jgi:MFS superfamily sulfate permease-like transporter
MARRPALGLATQGVAVVGDIPATLPSFRVPNLSAPNLRDLAESALAIALLGLLEAIAMAKAIAAVTGQRLDLNQQCLSEGLANFTGSFFQCMPGSGSLTRSAINQQAGARTQWSGVVSAVAVALIMLVFAPYARFIPRSALAGLLMLTAARMVNLHDLRYHVRTSRFDAVIVAVTAISAFAISIEFCVLIGVFMSFLLAVPRTGHMQLTEFVVTEDRTVAERQRGDTACTRMLIFGLEGEMFFGAGSSLEHHLDTVDDRVTPETQAVVLRLKRARNPDAVGMALLEQAVDRWRARGVMVVLCGVRAGMLACPRKLRARRQARPRKLVPRAAGATNEHGARDPPRVRARDRSLPDVPEAARSAPHARDVLRDLTAAEHPAGGVEGFARPGDGEDVARHEQLTRGWDDGQPGAHDDQDRRARASAQVERGEALADARAVALELDRDRLAEPGQHVVDAAQ